MNVSAKKTRAIAGGLLMGQKRILRLNLKRKWWEQIRDGEKTCEYRLVNDHWSKRLGHADFDEVHLCLGYPPASDESRILKRKFIQVSIETILHEEFGDEPVEVFAIELGAL